MKKILTFITLALIVVSCNKEFDNAMKSADKEVILKAADKYYEKKNWKQALALYDRLPNLLAGTDELADMSYKQASRDYNLDQESTIAAINELQEFLNTYPGSERSKNISKLVDELSYKLEFKAYENARQYYKMAEYKAADIAFENVLEDYPSTKLRPQIFNYMMRSKERLATLSSYDLKSDRIENAISFTKQVEREFHNSDNSKDAVKISESLEHEKENFAKLKVEYDKRRAEREARIKRLSAEQAAEMEKKAENNRKAKAVKEYKDKVRGLQKDSAILNTPPPAATFKIPRKSN